MGAERVHGAYAYWCMDRLYAWVYVLGLSVFECGAAGFAGLVRVSYDLCRTRGPLNKLTDALLLWICCLAALLDVMPLR